MTARSRLVPLSQCREYFDYLRELGIAVEKCGVDIGPDYIKVSPPANSDSGDTLGFNINRNSHNPKAAKGR